MRTVFVAWLALLSVWVMAQPPEPLVPSHLPSVGRTYAYRLLVNGEVQVEVSGIAGVAHFAADADIEQRWQGEGNRLRCDITLKGGTLRVFSTLGEQRQKMERIPLIFVTTPFGEVVELRGGGARSLDELTANFDLLATALATLLVPFPQTGLRAGDAWKAVHRFGSTFTLTTVQCVEIVNPTPLRSPIVKLRLRYTLPMDALIDPSLRSQMNLTARYAAESEVLFGVAEGRTLSASGKINLEVGGRLPQPPPVESEPKPDQPLQEQSQPQQEAPNPPPPESPPPLAPSFQLRVDAKFELLTAR